MAIAVLLQSQENTPEGRITVDETLSAVPAEGILAVTSGSKAGGFCVFSVWNSREDYERFRQERLLPALREAMGEEAAEAPSGAEIYEVEDVYLERSFATRPPVYRGRALDRPRLRSTKERDTAGGPSEKFDFSPAARATRGEALLEHAQGEWPRPYEGSDPVYQVLQDVVHAVFAAVPVAELPQATSSLLGAVAADAIVERAVEAGGMASEDEIWRMIQSLKNPLRGDGSFTSATGGDTARGAALLEYAEERWAGAYEGGDFGAEVVRYVVHAALADIDAARLPEALGSLLGTVAVDVVRTRSGDIGQTATLLEERAQQRHYG